ncbi:MAG: TlpA family protein disulfide reductase [Planktomarina sp.]
MRFFFAVLLYTALILPANADGVNIADLRDGDMRRLQVLDTPRPAGDSKFTHEDGSRVQLSDWKGQVLVVNFWATWCAPCRKEMPHFAELQSEFGGDDFQVLTIAVGPQPMMPVDKFFANLGIDNLPHHTDITFALSRQMAVLGLPGTVVIDRDGNEVARLNGDADWASDSAKAIIKALIDG